MAECPFCGEWSSDPEGHVPWRQANYSTEPALYELDLVHETFEAVGKKSGAYRVENIATQLALFGAIKNDGIE